MSDSTIDRRPPVRTPVRTSHGHPSLRERVEPVATAWRPLVFTWVGLLTVVTAVGLLLVGPLDDGRIVRWDIHVERWFVDHRRRRRRLPDVRRVPLPSDCVAGASVGVIWLTVSYRTILRRTELTGRQPAE